VVARVRALPGDAARAVYDGAPGHPVVIRRPLLARAGELRGDSGFRDLLAGVAEVECADLADPTDIDTQADLEVVRR
jgi:CTP:molybdopterin cytidylyltransferase MocA